MPKVHHGKVRKDHPNFGIKKGEEAYWWTIKTGPTSGFKTYSKTAPKQSQLTRSEFAGAMCDFQDEIAALTADDGLESSVADIAGRIRELGEEQDSKKDAMPEGLQEGPTGQLLQERSEKCGEIADELDGIDFSDAPTVAEDSSKAEGAEDDDDQTEEEYWQAKLDEVQSVDTSAP